MIRRVPGDAAGEVVIEHDPGAPPAVIRAGTAITMSGGPCDGRTFYVMRDVKLAAPGGQVEAHVEQLGRWRLRSWQARWWLGRTWLGRTLAWLGTG